MDAFGTVAQNEAPGSNGGLRGIAPEAARDKTHIQMSADRHQEIINQVVETAEHLRTRLNAVLRMAGPSTQEGKTKTAEGSPTPLAAWLDLGSSSLHSAQAILQDIHNRLEL